MLLIQNACIQNGKKKSTKTKDILIADGKIKDIQDRIPKTSEMSVENAKGKFVCPGFIEALNVWGAMGPGWGDNDLKEASNPMTPYLNTVYSFDQDSMMFQRVFEYGVTTAGLSPAITNVIGGQVAVFKTFGDHPYKMLLKEEGAMRGSFAAPAKKLYGGRNALPMTKMGMASLIQDMIQKTQDYLKKKEKDILKVSEAAFAKVLQKKMPLFMHCNTKSDIDAIERLLKDVDVDVVYTGAYGVKGFLNKKGKRGILLGDLTEAMSPHGLLFDAQVIKDLMKQGHDVAISSCGDYGAAGKESLLWNGMLYHKYGFSSAEVLYMMTGAPAKMLGIDKRVGQIAKNKDADILIWSQDPIENFKATLEKAYINGEDVLKDRRTCSCW